MEPPLQALFEAEMRRLEQLAEERLKRVEQLQQERFERRDYALQLQAGEVGRRLSELNHAHEAAVKEQQRVLPRENFDLFMRDYDKFREETNGALQTIATRSTTWNAAIALFVIIVSLVLRYWPTH